MREELARYHDGQLYTFTAYFEHYSKTPFGSNVALLRDVRVNQQRVADHLFIHRSQRMKALNLNAGDVVVFEARVGVYLHNNLEEILNNTAGDYRLEKIRDMRIKARSSREFDNDEA